MRTGELDGLWHGQFQQSDILARGAEDGCNRDTDVALAVKSVVLDEGAQEVLVLKKQLEGLAAEERSRPLMKRTAMSLPAALRWRLVRRSIVCLCSRARGP